jgi:hypothetical protein
MYYAGWKGIRICERVVKKRWQKKVTKKGDKKRRQKKTT